MNMKMGEEMPEESEVVSLWSVYMLMGVVFEMKIVVLMIVEIKVQLMDKEVVVVVVVL